MRYVIGCEMINKQTKETTNGYYAYGEFGFAFILKKENFEFKEDRSYYIDVFNTKKDAEIMARSLARAYRRDDVAFSKPKIKSKYIRNFYLLKVDSSNFNLKLEICNKATKKYHRNEFNEKIEKVTATYSEYKILGYK